MGIDSDPDCVESDEDSDQGKYGGQHDADFSGCRKNIVETFNDDLVFCIIDPADVVSER